MSTYNLSALFSVLAMGSLYDPEIDSACHDFKARRQLARALFFYNWPGGPTAIDEMESLLLLFRTSWPFLDTSAAANYELLAWGIKLGGKVMSPIIQITNPLILIDFIARTACVLVPGQCGS